MNIKHDYNKYRFTSDAQSQYTQQNTVCNTKENFIKLSTLSIATTFSYNFHYVHYSATAFAICIVFLSLGNSSCAASTTSAGAECIWLRRSLKHIRKATARCLWWRWWWSCSCLSWRFHFTSFFAGCCQSWCIWCDDGSRVSFQAKETKQWPRRHLQFSQRFILNVQ